MGLIKIIIKIICPTFNMQKKYHVLMVDSIIGLMISSPHGMYSDHLENIYQSLLFDP